MTRGFISALLPLLLVQFAPSFVVHAAEAPTEVEEPTAPIQVDGRELFRVRGIAAYPPEVRAQAIGQRITAIARDPQANPELINVVEKEYSSDVMLGQRLIVSVTDADASIEGIGRQQEAQAYQQRVRAAIDDYRRERSAAYLQRTGLFAGIFTLLFTVAMWLVVRGTRRLIEIVESRSKRLVRSVSIQSFQILQEERIWLAVRALLRVVRYLLIAALVYAYVQYVLDRFPWTRPVSQSSLGYIVDPLVSLWTGFLSTVPDLIVVTILVLIARYVTHLLRLFFDAVGRGSVRLQNFDTDWAAPTYRIVRFVVIIFTAVVAYPYIPGSGSEAFKGITLLLGVMLSIGSGSFISNLIAGYVLTYRRVFKVGNWVKIDDIMGEVIKARLQVTHLRSIKNEEITVPNSVILNSKVVNYSSLKAERHLILHTQVGIGYEVAWRQVEAMLLLAAQRTPGVLQDPPPFVLQNALGDFAIMYELNAYCDDPSIMPLMYTAIHQSILDVFNEYGVQVMTPAYERDPVEPKVVPKDRWFTAPAQSAPVDSGAQARA